VTISNQYQDNFNQLIAILFSVENNHKSRCHVCYRYQFSKRSYIAMSARGTTPYAVPMYAVASCTNLLARAIGNFPDFWKIFSNFYWTSVVQHQYHSHVKVIIFEFHFPFFILQWNVKAVSSSAVQHYSVYDDNLLAQVCNLQHVRRLVETAIDVITDNIL